MGICDIELRVQLAHSCWRLIWLPWNICVLLTPVCSPGSEAKLIHHQRQALGSHLLLPLLHVRVSSIRGTPERPVPGVLPRKLLIGLHITVWVQILWRHQRNWVLESSADGATLKGGCTEAWQPPGIWRHFCHSWEPKIAVDETKPDPCCQKQVWVF